MLKKLSVDKQKAKEMLRRHSLNTSFWLANKKKTIRKTAEKSKK